MKLLDLLDRAERLKQDDQRGIRPPLLAGRMLGLIFEKPSLRTRVSFEAAIAQLGGNAVFLQGKDVGLGVRETAADFARVISQYVDILAVRTFSHAIIQELARHATIPVINALSDAEHPCQAMADLLTIREVAGRLEGVKLVFVGDGNNVAMSLAEAAVLVGVNFVLACPSGYEFPVSFSDRFNDRFPDVDLVVENDPNKAVAGADVIYTDVWTSMGQEDEASTRMDAFSAFRVDDGLMSLARADAFFLHCLPAHRGQEVTDDVLDGPQSRIIVQAANRLHFRKGAFGLVVRIKGAPFRFGGVRRRYQKATEFRAHFSLQETRLSDEFSWRQSSSLQEGSPMKRPRLSFRVRTLLVGVAVIALLLVAGLEIASRVERHKCVTFHDLRQAIPGIRGEVHAWSAGCRSRSAANWPNGIAIVSAQYESVRKLDYEEEMSEDMRQTQREYPVDVWVGQAMTGVPPAGPILLAEPQILPFREGKRHALAASKK